MITKRWGGVIFIWWNAKSRRKRCGLWSLRMCLLSLTILNNWRLVNDSGSQRGLPVVAGRSGLLVCRWNPRFNHFLSPLCFWCGSYGTCHSIIFRSLNEFARPTLWALKAGIAQEITFSFRVQDHPSTQSVPPFPPFWQNIFLLHNVHLHLLRAVG